MSVVVIRKNVQGEILDRVAIAIQKTEQLSYTVRVIVSCVDSFTCLLEKGFHHINRYCLERAVPSFQEIVKPAQ